MKLSDLLGKDIEKIGDLDIAGLTADSREVKSGFLFAALSGENHDGAAFIPQAEANGAIAVLTRAGVAASVPVVEVEEPRLALAKAAARFHPGQPPVIAGITGTNGKTSIARFCQQLWSLLQLKSGSLGTLGAYATGYEYTLRHTTPHPVEIHQILSTMERLGVSHVAMEVSSHGLAQYRADGVRFALAGFTNITQDHLDYHADFQDYLNAKLRLFTELLDPQGTAVVNVDGAGAEDVIKAIEASGRQLMTVGYQGQDIRLVKLEALQGGLQLTVTSGDDAWELNVPLVGAFQAENALVAAGLVMASGYSAAQVLPLLEKLEGAPGRMQLAAEIAAGDGAAGVYVDYAHTPDAIETALAAIKPHVTGRITIVMGAGGDRDGTKRKPMGEAACTGADRIIITDDNPRSEDPAAIRAAVREGCPQAEEVGDREAAIKAGMDGLQAGDVLLITGKGHETGQTVGTMTTPFNDRDVAMRLAAERSG
jgi:UDP-N-acetylmuramoyl-L-alanyl-D-glutamate--2,6-diaminopimelate ligase